MEVYGWEIGDKPLSIKIPIDIVQRMQDDIEYGLGMRTPCDVMGFLVGRLSKEYSASVLVREYILTGYTNDRGGRGLWNDERLAEMIKASTRPHSQHYVVGLIRSSARGWPEIDTRELRAARKLLKRTPNIFLLVHSGAKRTFTGRLYVKPAWRAKLDSEYGEFPLNSEILSAQWEATLPAAEKPSLHFVPGNPMHGRPRWQPPTPAQPPHIEAVFEHIQTEHIQTEHIETEPIEIEQVETEHIDTEHIETEHVTAEHLDTEHVSTEHVEAEHVSTEHVYTEHPETEQLDEYADTPAFESAETMVTEEEDGTDAPAIPERERARGFWRNMFRRADESAEPEEAPIGIPAAEAAAHAEEPMHAEAAPEAAAEATAEEMSESVPFQTPEEVGAAAAAMAIEEDGPREAAEARRETFLRRMGDRILSYLIEEVPVEDLIGESEAQPSTESIEEQAREEQASEELASEELASEASEPVAADRPHVIYSRTTETEDFDEDAEERRMHSRNPWFGDNPPPPPHHLRSWLSMAATWTIAVGLTLWYMGGRNLFHRGEVHATPAAVVSNPVGLEVESNGGLLNIMWDGTSASALHARGGSLTIRDGNLLKEVSLDPNDIRAGHIYYEAHGSDLGIRLEMPQDTGLMSSESIRVVGPPAVHK